MNFRLVTFGGLRLIDVSGKDVAFPQKGLLAICRLFDSPDFELPRDRLARFLWGDDDSSVSHVNLRKTLSRIKRRQDELKTRFIEIGPKTITLNANALESDFQILLRVDEIAPLPRLRSIARLLAGAFLENMEPESAAAGKWITQQRKRLAGELRHAFLQALPDARKEGEFALIRNIALRILEDDPFDEPVREAMLTAHNAERETGQSRGASAAGAPLPSANGLIPARPASITSGAVGLSGYPDANHPVGRFGKGGVEIAKALPRLALLPPVLAGGDLDPRASAHALIEDITIGLCALRTVSVVAPYTAAQISLHSDKANIIERHAIDYVLDCRVSPENAGGTLYTQLIHFSNDEVIWADRFSLAADGLLAGRREIATQIAGAIAQEIEHNRMTREHFVSNPQAYQLFLLGQRNLKQIQLPSARRARKLFRQAIAVKADYAPALSGIARTYYLEWLLTARGDGELLTAAEQFARRSIAADGQFASGYRELGIIRLYQHEFDESIETLDQAEHLSPHYADVIASHADALAQASRPADGLEKIQRSIALNPLCPDDYLWIAASACYSTEQYDRALRYIEQMKDSSLADRLSAACWAMSGDVKKARQFVRKTLEVQPDFVLDKWIAVVPFRDDWQREHYREGLLKAGF
ncbi:SARP family transcriptional regulator [Phyllobacterium salinisoli]|uniref:SARP family transcriptional regulator n=1 Tax=Phyllobacterium salinisoli TaxID=1899321 RepID=A0A368K274_9HYPH|nr:SARP family transcriptional regulator [Phyllobacterium salinisoli]RCS23487.1 SARP family transcriptional regulator [Phyllobacterium salinisoli]